MTFSTSNNPPPPWAKQQAKTSPSKRRPIHLSSASSGRIRLPTTSHPRPSPLSSRTPTAPRPSVKSLTFSSTAAHKPGCRDVPPRHLFGSIFCDVVYSGLAGVAILGFVFAMRTPHKTRLDRLLFDRGLVTSREKAQAMILAGEVLVNGAPVTKSGHAVLDDAQIE